MENAELFARFETYLLTERLVAKNTFDSYKSDLAQFASFLKEHGFSLRTLAGQELKFFMKHLRTIAGPRSVARKLSAVKSLYTFLHERYDIPNIMEEVHFPKFKKKLPVYLTEEEVEALLKVAEQDYTTLGVRNKIMLYLLYMSGMRISELTSMKLSAIHFDTGFINVMGKGGKERMVPLPEQMMALLRMYIKDIRSEFMQKGKGRVTDYLFPTIYGKKIKPISRQSLWIILDALWQKTGIKKNISPHKLRHSLATHMLKNGADLRALQIILGHENLVTVEIYTHVETSHMRKMYDDKHPRSHTSDVNE